MRKKFGFRKENGEKIGIEKEKWGKNWDLGGKKGEMGFKGENGGK